MDDVFGVRRTVRLRGRGERERLPSRLTPNSAQGSGVQSGMRACAAALALASGVTLACSSGPTAPSSASASCNPAAATANGVLSIFGRPFAGAFPLGNFFDHDKPIEGDANGYVLTLCGARDSKQVDGHPGYDWRMPEGTPLLAIADAVVLTAGLESPHFCQQLNRTVQALYVQLVHTAPTGELFVSVYGHLSRVDVQAGASVSEGTVIEIAPCELGVVATRQIDARGKGHVFSVDAGSNDDLRAADETRPSQREIDRLARMIRWETTQPTSRIV